MSALRKFYPLPDLHKDTLYLKYGKTKSDIESDVHILKEWLKKQPHIPEVKDDEFLEILLLRNKCRIERTKLKIDKYFSVKTAYSTVFLKSDPMSSELEFVDSYVEECVMPKLAPDGSRIFYLTMKPLKNAGDFQFDATFNYLMSRAENHLVLDYNDSVTMIANNDNLTLSMIQTITIEDMMRGMEIFLGGFSGRVNSMFLINAVPATDILYKIIRPLLPSKLKSRIHVLKKDSNQMLFEKIPKDCLPIEIGGTGPSIKELSKEYNEAMKLDREYIINRNQNGTIESRRIGKPTVETQMYGVEGTFRSINID